MVDKAENKKQHYELGLCSTKVNYVRGNQNDEIWKFISNIEYCNIEKA